MNAIRTGLTSVTFRQKTIDEIVALAHKAQLDGIEWGGDLHVPAGDVQAARHAAKATADAGLSVLSYGSYFHGDEGEDFAPVLESAKALGAPMVRVWAERSPYEECSVEAFSRCVTAFQKAADMAAEAGIAVGFEYHRGTFTQTRAGAAALLDAVSRENVSCYWQPNPDISLEEQLLEMDALLPRLSNIHVFYWTKNNVRHPLSEGIPLWEQYVKHLQKANVPRAMILEFVEGDSHEAFLRDAATLHRLWVPRSLQILQKKYRTSEELSKNDQNNFRVPRQYLQEPYGRGCFPASG